MTADEIRNFKLEVTCDVQTNQVAPMVADCGFMLREIAAQMAETNQYLKIIADTLYSDGMAKYGG